MIVIQMKPRSDDQHLGLRQCQWIREERDKVERKI